jgi:phytoene/squalene synthetase
MDRKPDTSRELAGAITKAASKQTYYTIRFLADRERVGDAYRAYAYFRWVDDIIDESTGDPVETAAFIERQASMLQACYRGETPSDLCLEETMLLDLVRNDDEENSGLRAYLFNMMEVMRFDAGRRGRVVSHAELCSYTRHLAVAVTEAMHFFIGHDNPTPTHEARYLAVTAAHITHMLRDAQEDVQAGYFNIPREVLQSSGISPRDVGTQPYREWVRSRVQLARRYFEAGRDCISHVRSLRCRLAGYAYTARFEWMLRAIERDGYHLRPAYPERKSLLAGLWMGCRALAAMLASPCCQAGVHQLAIQPARSEER